MDKPKSKKLWSNTSRTRHFLIPDEVELPAGTFELRTLTGRNKHIDQASIVQYEVTHEQAQTWLKDQFAQVIDTAKESILDSMREKMAQKPDLDAWFNRPRGTPPPQPSTERSTERPKQQDKSKAKPKEASPALSLFAKLSGISPEQLNADPESFERALQSLLGQAGDFFSDATAEDETRLKTAREHIQTFRSTLQQHGLNVSEGMDRLPDKLREAYRSAEQDMGAGELAQHLESLADGLQKAADQAAGWLRKQAKELRNNDENTQTSAASANQEQTTTSGSSE